MIQNCNEQLLDDVVRVDLVLASECKIGIPFQIAKSAVRPPTSSAPPDSRWPTTYRTVTTAKWTALRI